MGDNVDTDLDDGTGQFTFSLLQYMDSGMSDLADADDQTALGATMYFQLAMNNPVSTVDWVLTGTLKSSNILFVLWN